MDSLGVISSGDLRKHAAEYTKKREEGFNEWRRATGIYVTKAQWTCRIGLKYYDSLNYDQPVGCFQFLKG